MDRIDMFFVSMYFAIVITLAVAGLKNTKRIIGQLEMISRQLEAKQ
jgi:hypothetical protein